MLEVSEGGSGFNLGSSDGLIYLIKYQERADQAWNKLFDITKLNYIAVGGACTIISGAFLTKFPAIAIITILSIFITMTSFASVVMCYFYLNYSIVLYGYAKEFEKGWLRNKNGRIMKGDLETIRNSVYARRANDFDFSKEGWINMLSSVYTWVNLIPVAPAVVAVFFAFSSR